MSGSVTAARRRRETTAIEGVIRTARAFQKADEAVDEAVVDDDATYAREEAAMEERARCIRELFDALDALKAAEQ